MNIRQVHLMEPYWNTVLTEQAAGRAVRLCSHATLKINRRKLIRVSRGRYTDWFNTQIQKFTTVIVNCSHCLRRSLVLELLTT